jgi:hypothetical protein
LKNLLRELRVSLRRSRRICFSADGSLKVWGKWFCAWEVRMLGWMVMMMSTHRRIQLSRETEEFGLAGFRKLWDREVFDSAQCAVDLVAVGRTAKISNGDWG